MQQIEWILVVVPLAVILVIALYTRRFMKSVADFLAGGRCAGRYLIANAYGESASGVANTMSKFEIFMLPGFTYAFWNALSIPVQLLVAVSGFVVYRYRQTRSLTLAQFFEMRYTRRFRLFMGMLAFVAGILNYGIFPAVSSKFFVYFMGLPETVSVFGRHLPTVALIMASYLTCVLLVLMSGGHITQMVSSCVEGLISLLVLLIMIVAMLYIVGWAPVVDVLGHQPKDQSMMNPFDAWAVQDFNFGYVVMALIIQIYSTMAFQNTQGFNAAAKTPHESRMAAILGNWRVNTRVMLLLVITTIAVAFLNYPQFVGGAHARQLLDSISDPQIRKQMRITATLRYLLPPGIRGLFCSTMIMGLIAGDCTHLHSWSSIFVQDVILPFRKRPLSTRQHLWLLRLSLVGVATFAFCFSLGFTQTHYIAMWWKITEAIFVSGAGAAIIGGLYWRKGTTSAAWSSVVVGAVLAFTGILLNQYWPDILVKWTTTMSTHGIHLPDKFPLNGTEVAFVAMLIASTVYVIVSLITNKGDFNLDQMLHRGKYATEPESPKPRRSLLTRMANIDENFTKGDRGIAFLVVGFTLLLALVNGVVAILNIFFHPWGVQGWANFWLIFGVSIPFTIGAATFIWFTIGGIRDMGRFFRDLKTLKRDAHDDGRVYHHQNLDTKTLVEESQSASAN